MKLLYSFFGRTVLTVALFLSLNSTSKAQVLVAGDIAFTGYISNGVGTEAFSFVLLVNVPSGTIINFTDNGWNGASLNNTEQTLTWTSTSAIVAGREIHISGPSGAAGATAVFAGNGSSAGTCTGLMPSFVTSGDQLFGYQGTAAAPTFISGIHMNNYCACLGECGTTTFANWDPVGCGPNGSHSAKPPSLTTGVNAVMISTEGVGNSDADNAKFTGCGQPLATPAQVRAAVNNSANWTTSSVAPPTFGLPSSCAFLGLFPLPVKLESFTGKLNSDKTVTLQWKVSEQQDVQQYVIEESADGNSYSSLGSVAPGAGDTYSLIDQQVSPGKNYYRLKTTELSGKITYSNVIVINLKAGIVISLYPNPVTDKLTIQQFGTIQNKTAVLTDQQGRVLQQISLTSLQQTVSMERYTAGVYMLKMADGSTYKIVKE